MGLRDLHLKPVYYSDEDNLLQDFYIPALSNSVRYDRIAGYFSSNSLAVAARGIANLIANGGEMRLIANVVLSSDDQEAIRTALQGREEDVLEEIENLEDQLKRDHVRMLGWMVKKKLLNIKIAVVRHGLEHQKIGILTDAEGEILSFSGSDNETVQGWLRNDEQFHVFCGWREGDRNHLFPELARFTCLWNDEGRKVRVYAVSEAFKKGLIRDAPRDDDELKALSHRVCEAITRGAATRHNVAMEKPVSLRPYQIKALGKWLANGGRGIFEMATGTGKTFTALGCLAKICERDSRLVAVIGVPYGHLTHQWRKETAKFGLQMKRQLVADSTNASWRDQLSDALMDLKIGHIDRLLVFTTHNTLSSPDFIKILSAEQRGCRVALLADEVHSTGASKLQRGLQECYDLRLGLSATPRRWFDDLGTKTIYDYFGDVVFEFPLRDAIHTVNPETGRTYLTPYEYCPLFVSLDESEIREYIDLTHSIVTRLGGAPDETVRDELVSLLAFRRADIVKNARAKYGALDQLLGDLGASVRGMIIYCSAQQIDEVMRIVNRHRIVAHRFTMSEDFRPDAKYGGRSERERILERFAEGEYQALVAMKCLDEGVDVPPATTAVIMASSGNPREYIQRLGRVIRHYPGKDLATVYDLVVVPSFAGLPVSLRNIERSVLEKELSRYEEIAKVAVNSVTALNEIYAMRDKSRGGRL